MELWGITVTALVGLLDAWIMQVERIRQQGRRGTDPAGVRWRRRCSILLAGAVLLLGLSASLAGGLWWRASDRAQNRRAFQATASDVTATLATMLRRDADFVAATKAVATMEPTMSATRFTRWYAELEGRRRQIGGVGTAGITRVPAAAVGSFESRRNADASFRTFVAGRPVSIRTQRRNACLVSAGVAEQTVLSPALARELQGDWCDPSSTIGISEASLLQTQTDTREVAVAPATVRGAETMFFQAAFYRAGAP